MPKRPRQHRLEDESRNAFERAVPENWLFRPEYSDYGIDGSVEVFDQAGTTTGLRYYVQLKSTDAKLKTPPSTRIKRDTGEYYRTLALPVLVVLYHAPTQRLFVRWFHQFDPYYGGLGKKWITFKFPEGTKWDDQRGAAIENDLRVLREVNTAGLQTPVAITVELADDEFFGLSRTAVASRVRTAAEYIRDSVSVVRSSSSKRIATVRIHSEEITVTIAGARRSTLHIRGRSPDLDCLGNDVLLLVATALAREGHAHIGAEIILSAAEESSLLDDPMFLGEVARCFVQANRIPDLFDVFRRTRISAMDDPIVSVIESATLLMGQPGAEEQMAPFADYLDHEIEQALATLNFGRAATMSYSLGNLTRRNDPRRAAKHYLSAARLDKQYWKRAYFCQELGGTFFELRRYACSSKLYRMALNLGIGEEVRALLADALMHQGRYAEAIQAFDTYTEAVETTSPEWCLKRFMLNGLVSWLGTDTQQRRSAEATGMLASEEHPDEELVTEALQRDALCADAWFRLGKLKHQEGDNEDAFIAFLSCALVERHDLDAWCNAFGLVFKGVENWQPFLLHILDVAYSAMGERFISALSDYCIAQGESFPVTDVMNAVGEFLDQRRADKRESPPKMRFLGPDDQIVEFELSKPH